jgi:hypothetical protein
MPTTVASNSTAVTMILPQAATDLLNRQREKARATYEKNKAKIRVRDQARRNDAEQYERMKERSKLWNRVRYQEAKHEDYQCECGAHIKRVSLHTHVLTKKHLKALSDSV